MSAQASFFPEFHDPGGKVKLPKPAHWKSDAVWGGEKREYRDLLRYWWADGPILLGALMNPSVATPEWLDPTLAKFGRLAARWGYAGFWIVNACNYRCTDSKLLCRVKVPCTASNLLVCASAAQAGEKILVGYGKLHKSIQPHAAAMVTALRSAGKPLYVLGLNMDGSPVHPLYQREDTVPTVWCP